MLSATGILVYGTLASLAAGLATGAGALGVFLVRGFSERLERALLSGAAGVMLAASFFSLLLPGIDHGVERFGNEILAVLVVIAGLLAGAGVVELMHRNLPHEHFHVGPEGPEVSALARIWLFVIAITLHNFPEGMAVGVGFAGGDVANGRSLATGIGIQNLPEGLAVAVALLAAGYGRLRAFAVAFLSGLAEPLGGLFGSAAVSLAAPAMPFTLGFAGGAMLYVISHEIIPETHRGRFRGLATFALLVGFCIMMTLDATLG